MAVLISATRVTLLLWISLSRCSSQSITFQGKPPNISLVSNIINYVKPFLQSLQLAQDTTLKRSPTFEPKSFDDSSVKKAIDFKIKELMPMFQDGDTNRNKHTEDNLRPEGSEQTTIIEFVTNDDANGQDITMRGENYSDRKGPNIGKYETMRNKIKFALEKESVSKKTKKMVTRTLDGLITQLLGSQCQWSNDSNHIRKRTIIGNISDFILLQKHNYCVVNNTKLLKEDCVELEKIFVNNIDPSQLNQIGEVLKGIGGPIHNKTIVVSNAVWLENNTFFDFVHAFMQKKKLNVSLDKEMRKKTSSFLDIFDQSINRTGYSVPPVSTKPLNKYKVRCSVVDFDKVMARDGLSTKSICGNFRLCSQELKEFLTHFYKSLNDTAVSVLTNYAEMYTRDVYTDGSGEKNSDTAIIYNASHVVAGRVRKVFMKRLAKIKLDLKKRIDFNVKTIKDYVRSTVKHVTRKINNNLEADLGNLRARTLLDVKKDLHINLGLDLGNLESDFLGKVCSFFVTCNGEVADIFRKRYPKNKTKYKSDKKSSSVYVKVQLTLDDELKDTIVKNHEKLLRNKKNRNFTDGYNIKVTRTTTHIEEPATSGSSHTT